jgi:hypothetical protein
MLECSLIIIIVCRESLWGKEMGFLKFTFTSLNSLLLLIIVKYIYISIYLKKVRLIISKTFIHFFVYFS